MPNLLDRYPLSERYQERAEANMPFGSTAGGEVTNPRLVATETQHVKADSGVLGSVNVQGQFELNPLGSMAAGQTAYNTGIGWFFDIDPTAGPRFSIGDSSPGENKLLWDGDELIIVGSITADDGEIGGWEIGASQLEGGDVVLDSSGIITVGDSDNVAVLSSVDPTYRLWVGDAAGVDAPFSITQAGALKSISGEIGGWDIGATTISAGDIVLDSAQGRLEFGTDDWLGDNEVHFGVTGNDERFINIAHASWPNSEAALRGGITNASGTSRLQMRASSESNTNRATVDVWGGDGADARIDLSVVEEGGNELGMTLAADSARLRLTGFDSVGSAGSIVDYMRISFDGQTRLIALYAP